MQQIQNYETTQAFIDKLTGTNQHERHAEQREYDQCENRAARRERKREAKKAKVKA